MANKRLQITKNVAGKYITHKGSTTANQASGTSSHATNLNPEYGASLTKLHGWLADISCGGACKAVVKYVCQENGREKCSHIEAAVVTR